MVQGDLFQTVTPAIIRSNQRTIILLENDGYDVKISVAVFDILALGSSDIFGKHIHLFMAITLKIPSISSAIIRFCHKSFSKSL